MSFANPKVEFSSGETALSNDGGECCRTQKVLCVETTFLDYGSIEAKKKVTAQLVRQERSSIAQCFGYRTAEWSILGLVIAKLWNREPKAKPPQDETPTQKKTKTSRSS